MRRFFLHLLFMLSCLGYAQAAQDLVYRLPTTNDALFREDHNGFYMYCDRNFEGTKSQPWEAGTYGMVRNPFRTADGELMFSRMHEGIDVKPLHRDAKGEPLDQIRPIAPGKVVHVNNSPGSSNYGRYVVVAHRIPEGTIYSLYAHLASVSCTVGQRVGTGNVLGIMGHTGVGLDRVRSHLHLEIGLLINEAYDQFCPASNKQGIYNGLNLIGIDPTDILLQSKDGEPVSITRYFSTLKEHYRVRVPRIGTMDFLKRYPFLYKGKPGLRPKSLDMVFTASGVPIAIYPSDKEVSEPTLIACKPMPTLQQNCTVNRLKNSSKNAALTASGRRYIDQYLWLEGRYPVPPPEPTHTNETPTHSATDSSVPGSTGTLGAS